MFTLDSLYNGLFYSRRIGNSLEIGTGILRIKVHAVFSPYVSIIMSKCRSIACTRIAWLFLSSACLKVCLCLGEDKGIADGSAGKHDAIPSRLQQHPFCILGCEEIA